jgi:hypothetical protein
VFESLGKGFALLAFGADAQAVSALVNAAAELGLPLTLVQDTAQDERQRYAAPLVLVRPDQFVAWVGTGTVSREDALLILQRNAGKLPRV